MSDYSNIYIDGAWVPSDGDGSIEVINAGTEQVMGSIPNGAASDVDKAVAAAKAAFESWSATPVEERQKYLVRLNEALQARSADIAATIAGEVGMPITWATMIQAGLPTGNMQTFATLLDSFQFEEEIGNSLVVKEPVGVVGAITPWNYPLHQIICKVGGALAAGCTIVLKPSEVAPLNAFILAEIVHDVGLPNGVFNLVTGTGPVVGEAIAAHPDVDMVSFTGSTRAGKRVAEVASQTVKRVALELGGKSANIVLDDADFETVIPKGLFACYLNSGQTCTAHTRMLVPNSRYDEAVGIAAAAAEQTQVGSPTDEGMHLGPLISQAQWDRVQGYIQTGIDEGATVAAGGLGKPEGHETGYFVKPTVLAGVTNDMTVAQEEIFGPVLSIIGYDDDDDAVRIANDSLYGLSGGVWSGDQDRAIAVARRMRTGAVDVNGGSFNIAAPFGGYKQSGYGRENGVYGIEEFLETKSLQL
ncbi:aldehyde dehydrogenase family protein [Ilumatobacter nonamiensis]|uniref:aldehyde dehydrogenase family protein n=1 Tax=Ilumatobacter nonamiensis TaxID=467093 RepID=UPI000347EC1E|nr:aldehyde dehydrogenase family protein [Ilumatobacter nonamiensis]